MPQSKKWGRQQKTQILQKDLSFSNQIFKKSFNQDQLKSQKSSEENIAKNMIPPLIKYTDDFVMKENIDNKVSTKDQNRGQTIYKSELFNIFTKSKKFGDNFNDEDRLNLDQSYPIPPLSKLQEMIHKKYKRNDDEQKKGQSSSQRQKYGKNKTTVHFDKTEKLEEAFQNSRGSIQPGFNIESLDESRIANESIQRQNNWVLGNGNDSSQFVDGQHFLLNNLNQNRRSKKGFNFNNQSFSRKINPLNLVSNSLHTSNMPEFIDDDDSVQQNNESINFHQHLDSIQTGQLQIIKGSKLIENPHNIIASKFQSAFQKQSLHQRKQKSIKEVTMGYFQHYIEGHFIDLSLQNLRPEQKEDRDEVKQSILINEPSQNFQFDRITTKTSPNKKENSYIGMMNQKKSVSEADPLSRSIDFSIDSYSPKNSEQHFINDKSPQQILGSILSDQKKLKIFINYLHLKIAGSPQSSQIQKNYQLLSCVLMKIQSISNNNTQKTSPKTLSQSMLQIFATRNNNLSQTSQIKSLKPQIIRSRNSLKIDFDPYLKSQKATLNDKISRLKKSISQKNKEAELIKLSYEQIVQNLSVSIINLRNQIEASKKDNQKKIVSQKASSFESKSQTNSNESQKNQEKTHLKVFHLNRASMEGDKIHRKATFGKVPSSFRGSGNIDI